MLRRAAGEIGRQLIELEFPEAAVLLHPRRRVAHRRGDERRAPDAPLAPHARQSGAFEDPDMLRHGGQRHREPRRQITDGALAGGEAGDDRPAGGVGQRGKGAVERRGLIVNHMVYYCRRRATCQGFDLPRRYRVLAARCTSASNESSAGRS